ncbi:hypothetical protein DUNSADRAFT_16182 [Dunaliella salina]|uniref:Uncharacterized protein n=1 Tax=Dunaliella salina TaxID=3046 RepID=A0ABQ7G433_DUNSA|nr:hypothetical protein DUNSADRAFT_16182 [Dunaliella salina]|eukprot:KAF5829379.1 hypothetical protein DUNSADRAFT_16182 [Dunaliella salina]
MRRPSLLSCFMPTCRAQEENEKAFLGGSQVRGITRPPPAAHVPPLQTPVYNSSTSSNRPVECSPHIWNSAMMEALPLSWAVVTSGADIVLHHHIGQESAAASVFSQAIQSMSCMGDSAAQHGENPVRKGVRPSSFLEALLGPQLEAAAWKAVRMGRPWKGNICMQLPATAHPRDPAGHCSMGISPKTTAAGKEDMQRVELATSMDTKDSAFSPRPRHLSSKGSIRFQDVDTGLDEECSLGNDGENAKGVKGSYNSLSGSFPGDSKLGSTRPLKDNLGLNCAARHDPSIQVEEKEADEQVKMERSASLSHASQLRRQRLCKNRSASFISSRSRKSSLQISETEVDRLLSEGGCESPTNMRTKTFLKSLSNMELSPSPEGSPRRYGLCMPGHKDRDISRHDARPPALAQSTTAEGKTETVDKPSFEGNNPERLPHPQPGGVGDSIMQDFSFDVSVSCLDHSMGQRNPLLVVISDSTEHLKVRTILTALAEAQLELLADLMPQHAIKFLAMESSEAVPQCVGQLARKHKDATIMCMDICGFTAMSKVGSWAARPSACTRSRTGDRGVQVAH